MKRYTGSETVEPGLYFNPRQLSFKSVDEEGPLPGSTDEVYRRVPILVLLVVGPILGLVYAVFLPFIGFAMVAMYLTGWLKRSVTTTPPADAKAVEKKAA